MMEYNKNKKIYV